jgi:type I restriction enzyme S subunit
MNKIDELILKYCPNGVEYKKLGEIGIFENIGVDKKIIEGQKKVMLLNFMDVMKNKHINKELLTMEVSASDSKIEKCDIKKYDIFITPTSETRNEIGFAAVADEDIPNAVYSYHIMRFRLNEKNEVTPYFISYLFESENLRSQILKASKGLTRFGLSVKDFAKLLIPLPPLPVQQEIVNILDKFTMLEAELEAELEARRKQYEYYRNELLTPKMHKDKWLMNGVEVEWKELGEIGAFYGGLTGKSKTDFQNGNAKFITYMNVYSNIAVNTNINDFVKIGENENQNKVEYGDVLFTGSSETPDECGISSVLTEKISEPLYLNSFCFGFRLHDKELFLPDFLKYLFREDKIREQIAKTANGVTRFNVSKKLFAKLRIPIPPLSEQERIVEILDKFDALANDLSEGLPAEITARKKQYEYYREKLLNFKSVE